MGIYDRHYIRDQPQPRALSRYGGSPLGMLSVTTWLIILCTAVFVVDSLMPLTWVTTAGPYIHPEASQNPADWYFEPLPPAGPQYPRLVELPIFDRQMFEQSGVLVVVGKYEVQQMHVLTKWLHFSTARGIVTFQPGGRMVGFEFWRLIGFQFLHANLPHLLFNMIGLFFFGPIVEQHLGRKRYLAFYLLSGIFGALMYLLLNMGGFIATQIAPDIPSIPGLLFNDPKTPLVGASAGVFGVLMAGAYLAPNIEVLLFFLIPMRLKMLAYGLVILALYTVITGGTNAGGEAGHLGGAIAGWYFIRHPHHLHGFFDVLGRVDPTSHHYRGGARPQRRGRGEASKEAEIDRILLKIKERGMHSLSDRERQTLQEASREG